MIRSLFSTNSKNIGILYFIFFSLIIVIVVLFYTFSLFIEISKLFLIIFIQNNLGVDESVLISFAPIIVYSNADRDKSKILSDNKGKAGIYMWTHLESDRIYIGSAIDLSKRFKNYFNKKYLERSKKVFIYNALLHHTHSAFSLSILEYIDVSNLNKEQVRKLILQHEDYYLVLIFSEKDPNIFNLLKKAGSSLGFKHTEETIANMKNRKHSAEIKVLLSEINKGNNNPMYGKTGENHPMYGKSHTAEAKALISTTHKDKTVSIETKAKISEALSGENNPRGMLGKKHSLESSAKISETKGGSIIFVYDSQGSLVNTFSSARKAAEHFNSTHSTIIRYVKNNKLFQDKWVLSFFEKISTSSNEHCLDSDE